MTTFADTKSKTAVLEFIQHINGRDADKAGALLTDGVALVFPGGVSFGQVQAFLEWAKTRYRAAHYEYDRLEEIASPGGESVVYASGTISGELNDGTKFQGIRSVDRFELKEGRIARKEAWSDMSDFLRKRGS